MKSRCVSQRTYIFVRFMGFVLVLLAVLFSFVYFSCRWYLMRESELKLSSVCSSVKDAVARSLDTLSAVSLTVLYSEDLTKRLSLLSQEQSPGMRRRDTTAVYNLLNTIIGPFQSVSQINLYTPEGMKIGSGFSRGTAEERLESLVWYSETLRLNGYKWLSAPMRRNDLPGENRNAQSRMFISLTRVIKTASGDPAGFVEVIQDCDRIFSLASELEESMKGLRVAVYNERGELMYPYAFQEGALDQKEASAFVSAVSLDAYGWKVVAAESKTEALASFNRFRTVFLCISAVSLFIVSLICFRIAEYLTRPLKHFASSVSGLTIDSLLKDRDMPALQYRQGFPAIAELLSLDAAFGAMRERLSAQTQELLASRAEELNARLHASQLFLNPHFLYNCLATISAMAEEDMSDEIVFFCESLCDYLRYVSECQDMTVSLSEELTHVEKYIDCMKIRLGNDLSYTIHIDAAVSAVRIPKLIILPLVENAFKHGFNKSPPWKLAITARKEAQGWKISVSDSGGNLSGEEAEALMMSFSEAAPKSQRLKIGGGGLATVSLRLKSLYGGQAFFACESEVGQFSAFTVGGPLEDGNG